MAQFNFYCFILQRKSFKTRPKKNTFNVLEYKKFLPKTMGNFGRAFLVLCVSTSIWVLGIPNMGQNLLFPCFGTFHMNAKVMKGEIKIAKVWLFPKCW